MGSTIKFNYIVKFYDIVKYKDRYDKIRLDNFRSECVTDIKVAKENYMKSLGCKLAEKTITQKTYWKILKNFMNKSRAPRVPPLKVNDKFVVDCKDKARLFNEFFADQCKPNINESVLPEFTPFTNNLLSNIRFSNEEIL